MNPWTRDVLGDLACALYSCGLEPIPCMEGVSQALAPQCCYVSSVQSVVGVLSALLTSFSMACQTHANGASV